MQPLAPQAAATPALSPDAVDVRWLFVDDVGPDHWPRLTSLLDDGERERASRFHFAQDRDAYVAAHALARALLAAHGAGVPGALRFAATAHGKPELAPEDGAPPLRFNLTHTRGLVAVAVTLDNDVGVDVEAINPARLSLELAARTFAPAEIAHLRGLPAADLPEALFGFWTLKEAYIKAVGRGLSLGLETFACRLSPPGISFAPAAADNPACWRLERFAPSPGHALALALRHAAPARVRVHAGRITGREMLALLDGAPAP
ncbi:4'-phosphopantetheinyl transferase family protein [Azorhizobium doebereinerae]|uniref:4'-phosphopantetheinyl transferase family protein n=1 Tax=Azorhizobium doebereinerae TaxID=281091 RepID=UPI00041E7E3E|nr:4'-phosphopantetheinyl transferase superfamily protein [Azorhizobium doebereinerae]